MAADHTRADDGVPDVTMTIVEIVEEACGSASLLAQAFGSSVLEPAWWPVDTGPIDFFVTRSPGQAGYRIGSIRGDGAPVGIIARVEAAEARRSPRDWLPGEWREPSELVEMQGLIGRVGIPPHLQAFVYGKDLTVVLIGYQTDDEIFRAVKSLRPVKPD